jgi:hypothetical protein
VTLSYADCNWQDIEKLLNGRRNIVVDPPASLNNITEMFKAVNYYSIIIQEYLQARVIYYMENYAKDVFGIHHYYARFEFAKSQGHIHVHNILAMLGQTSRIIELNKLVYTERDNAEKQVQVAEMIG